MVLVKISNYSFFAFLFSLATTMHTAVNSLTFELSDRKRMCFFETADIRNRCHFEFQASKISGCELLREGVD